MLLEASEILLCQTADIVGPRCYSLSLCDWTEGTLSLSFLCAFKGIVHPKLNLMSFHFSMTCTQ